MVSENRFVKKSARLRFGFGLLVGVLASVSVVSAQYPTKPEINKDGTAVLLEDYASVPLVSPTHGGAAKGTVDMKAQLGRVTYLRSEPTNAPMSASRFFVNDESDNTYILDKATKKFTPYISFADIFPRFASDLGNSSGLVSITFDPNYAKNGKFYTVHVEKKDLAPSAAPLNGKLPGLNLSGYAITPAINPPAGAVNLESVLIEWTDTNIRNATFEGTAREILRVGYDRNHPIGDTMFNPLAKPGSPDYGNLYISVGDGAQGETPGPSHTLPQRLDTLEGKIIRITPDINLRPNDKLGANGRYRIPTTGPDPNPFVSLPNAMAEVYAYGLRNPHRLAWDTATKTPIVADIGIHSWEEVNILIKGANYGHAEREGNEQVFVDSGSKTGSQMSPMVAFPDRDLLHVDGIDEPVTPVYPAAVYGHADGDSIGSGYVYRGKLMPQLRGKYIFNDMTTGRMFYVDLAQMLATHGQRNHQAPIHELQVMYKKPDDAAKTAAKSRIFTIVADTYKQKGGTPGADHVLPGNSSATTGWVDTAKKQPKADGEGVPYGGGRADTRVAMGGDGELYVLSKSDGMIRKLSSVVTPPPASK